MELDSHIGYDRLRFYYPMSDTRRILEHPALSDKTTFELNGRTTINGKLNNLSLKITPQRLLVDGSLATYEQGNNQTLHTPESLRESLLGISKLLDIELLDATVWRFEFAGDMEMENAPDHYFHLFKGVSPNKKNTIKGTKYIEIREGKVRLALYDKGREQNLRGCNMGNVLRSELRYLKQLRTIPEIGKAVKAIDLCENSFYDIIKSHWKKYNLGVLSKTKEAFAYTGIKGKKDLNTLLLSLTLSNASTRSELEYYIEDSFRQGIVGKNFRKELLKIYQYLPPQGNPLLSEVSEKIEALSGSINTLSVVK
jgi:hypothetical protein